MPIRLASKKVRLVYAHLPLTNDLQLFIRVSSRLAITEDREGIAVVDAGGGTVDVSTHKRTEGRFKKIEEIAVPKCYFHRNVFVTLAAKDFLRRMSSVIFVNLY